MAISQGQGSGFYGWKNLIFLAIGYFIFMGVILYGYGVVFPAMIKAMKWARGDASIAHTIRTLCVGFLAPLAAFVINRWGTRASLIAGGIFCLVSTVLLGTATTELWQWTLLWGFGVGIGTTLGGVMTYQTNAANWFNKNRGMAIGIVLTGSGLGGFVAQVVFAYMMKQTGQWQIGWITAAGCAAVGLVVLFFVKNKPEDLGQYPDGLSPEKAQEAAASGRRTVARTFRATGVWTLKEALRTRQLYIIMLTYLATTGGMYLLTSHAVLHMTDKGMTTMQAAYVLSFVLLFSGFGRFPAGWLSDYIEARWLISVMLLGELISLAIFWQAPGLTSLIMSACVFGLAFGAMIVLAPAITSNYYGTASFANLQGFMYPFQIGFAAIVPVGAGYIFDFNRSYDWAFIIILVFVALATVSALLAAPPSKEN